MMGELLKGKVAIVTGASRGIGKAVALTFAHNGADLVITARGQERLASAAGEIEALGSKVLPVTMDVALEDDTQRMAEEAMSRFGHIDILVNNAGILGDANVDVWQATVEEWDLVLGVNLRGAFLCCRSVLPHMIEQGSGSIINMASNSGRLAQSNLGPYATSKWGLIGYNASLAKSVRPYGIRVNAISPGLVETDMMPRESGPQERDMWTTVEEISGVALFLVTAAPQDMTGQSIDVFDSGRPIVRAG